MRLLLLCFVASITLSFGAITLKECVGRPLDMKMESETTETYIFAGVICTTDSDLYYKNGTTIIQASVPADWNAENATDVAAARINTELVAAGQSNPDAYNWAKLKIADGNAVPMYAFGFGGNLRMSCASAGVQLDQGAEHAAPMDFLYTLKPQKNPINAVWQSFGAYNFPEAVVTNTIAFGTTLRYEGQDGLQNGKFTEESIQKCLEAGELKVSATSDPASIWQYADKEGNRLTGEVVVKPAPVTCDIKKVEKFVSPKREKLFELLDEASTQKESAGAAMTFSTITNDVDFVGCSNLVDSLYTKQTETVKLPGVKACNSDEGSDAWAKDPCCNQTMEWSSCCKEKDMNIDIGGLFKEANVDAIKQKCGKQAGEVTTFINDVVGPSLLLTQHPEKGCEAVARKSISSKMWTTLTSAPRKCYEAIERGKSITGQDKCNSKADCYTGSCVSYGGSSKQCARASGEAMYEPLLACMVSSMDKQLWKYVASQMGVDDSILKAGIFPDRASKAFTEAAKKLGDLIGFPSCSTQGMDAWCVVALTSADCEKLKDSSSRTQWITDPDNSASGWCILTDCHDGQGGWACSSHFTDEEGNDQCKAMISAKGGGCDSSAGYNGHANQADCEGDGKTWITFSAPSTAYYRLASTYSETWDEDTGNRKLVKLEGDKTKCEAEKVCNWDPGKHYHTTEAQCLTATNLKDGANIAQADFNETDGSKMACLECRGSWCDQFHAAHDSICAVAPHFSFSETECAQNSGGGPNNDAAVTAKKIQGNGEHYRCRRALATQAKCLIDTICPVPKKMEHQHASDQWIQNCAEPLCYDDSKTKDTCIEDHSTEFYPEWNEEWKKGAGLCIVHYKAGSLHTKTQCTAKSLKWWEGRAFLDGSFNNKAKCSTYCDDGTWPPAEQCDSTKMECNTQCAQCVPDDEDMQAVCINTTTTTESVCSAATGYTWNWDGQNCLKKVAGTKEQCTANANHEWYTCNGRKAGACSAYCEATTLTTQSACYEDSRGLSWDWDAKRCTFPTWMVNKENGTACSSLSEYTCWSENGCYWDGSACAGTSKGCNVQTGATEWVTAGADASPEEKKEGAKSAAVRASVLRCRWNPWERCSTKDTCLKAGECEDWFLWEGAACIVPFQMGEGGWRKECHEMQNPTDNTPFQYADKAGCIARKSSGGLTKAECTALGVKTGFSGAFYVDGMAKSAEQCQKLGRVCRDNFEDWRIYGGFDTSGTPANRRGFRGGNHPEFMAVETSSDNGNEEDFLVSGRRLLQTNSNSGGSGGSSSSKETCTSCGHKLEWAAQWSGGSWTSAAARNLTWVKRELSMVNKWETSSPDKEKFQTLMMNGVAKIQAAALKTKIMCLVAPIETSVSAIGTSCSEGDEKYDYATIEYNTSTTTVSCGNVKEQSPEVTGGATADFGQANCAGGVNMYAQVQMSNSIPVGANAAQNTAAQRMRRASECATHEVITNGQKMSSGTKLTGMSNVGICLAITVPDTQVCSKYTTPDVVEIKDGKYGLPLGKKVTKNKQGQYCFKGAVAGKTYAPVLTRAGAVKKTIVTQDISISSLSLADYKGDVEKVYETAYGISIKIWDSSAKSFKTGCEVDSTAKAKAARRAGVTITFTATISNNQALADSASVASQTLASTPAGFLTAMATAKTDLKLPNVKVPAAGDLTVAAPQTTTTGGSTSGAGLEQITSAASVLFAVVLALFY